MQNTDSLELKQFYWNKKEGLVKYIKRDTWNMRFTTWQMLINIGNIKNVLQQRIKIIGQ